MALENPPPHLQGLLDNLKESLSVLDIHEKVSGQGRGRKHGVEVLNKSALVLIVACWEAYVEDTIDSALTFMIDNCTDHTVFPKNVLDRVSSGKQGPKAWDLAGEGWKDALRDNLTGVLSKTTGALNTPRAKQVDELFDKVIGLHNLSSKWTWRHVTADQAIARLDTLITTRGSIAHRVKHSDTVYKKAVRDAVDLITRLAVRTNNEARSHVHSRVGKYPWYAIRYKSTH